MPWNRANGNICNWLQKVFGDLPACRDLLFEWNALYQVEERKYQADRCEGDTAAIE
jgi:hypothetical protein